jgi:hypothetical protein
VVVKVLKAHLDGNSSLEAEVATLVHLKHPNTILFMGACLDGPQRFLVTEYAFTAHLNSIGVFKSGNCQAFYQRGF